MISPTSDRHVPAARKLLLLLTVVFGGIIIASFLAVQEPLFAVGGFAIVLLAVAMFIWPNGVTLFVFFVLYTNAAVVAVRFHGVPFLVGAAVPALLAIPFGHYLVFNRKELIVDKVVPLMFFMMLIFLLGTLFAVDRGTALDNLITFALEGIVLYFLIINTVRTKKMLHASIAVLLLAGLLLGGLSFYQQVTENYEQNFGGFSQMSDAAFGTGEENILGEVEQPRFGGPLGQQNRYAQIMLVLAPLGLFQFWGSRSRAMRLLAILTTIFSLIAVVLTFSRGAAVGFVLLVIAMAFMRYIKLYHLLLVVLASALLLAAFPQFTSRLDSFIVLSEVITDEGTDIDSADGATRSRVTEMLAAVLMFADHPFIGVGPGMYPQHYQEYATRVGIRVLNTTRESHSLPLGLAAESGIFGIVAFGAILFITLRNLAVHRRKLLSASPEMAYMLTGLFLAIIAYMSTSLFLHFAYIRYFWLVMGLAGAANIIAQKMVEQANAEESAEHATVGLSARQSATTPTQFKHIASH